MAVAALGKILSKTDIPLSGLFNLNNLVNNSVKGTRSINKEQLLIFSEIIRGCDLPAFIYRANFIVFIIPVEHKQ